MIFKSTPICREWWGKFSLALQCKSIMKGDTPISKREVFDLLYDPDDKHQTHLELVMAGIHQEYHIVKRENFDTAEMEAQMISEITHDLLTRKATSILRRTENADTITLMVEGMTEVMEGYRDLQVEIRSKMKRD